MAGGGSDRSLALLQMLKRDRGVEAALDRGLDGLPAPGLDGLLGFGLPDDDIHAPNEKISLPNFFRGIEAIIRLFEVYAL